MPIAQQLADAISQANIKNLDEISHTVWKAFGAGHITDIDADRLSGAIDSRRAAYQAGRTPRQGRDAKRRSRASRSPDRARSIARRRSIAMSGAVPSPLACKFTMGELAVLSLIAQQVQRRGFCDWPMDRLAACAGVCRTTVRRAMREAQAQGLITVEERRRSYTRSETNIVRIVSPEWRTWLRLGGGCKKVPTTDNQLNLYSNRKLWAIGLYPFCSRHDVLKSKKLPPRQNRRE